MKEVITARQNVGVNIAQYVRNNRTQIEDVSVAQTKYAIPSRNRDKGLASMLPKI
jgi:hypothetical protein